MLTVEGERRKVKNSEKLKAYEVLKASEQVFFLNTEGAWLVSPPWLLI